MTENPNNTDQLFKEADKLMAQAIDTVAHLNRFELIQSLKETNSLSREQAQKIVELVFSSMANTLAKGGRVEIRGLCTFFVKDYKGYTGRNPKTGKHVNVKAKRLPFFKPGLDLKTRVDRQTKKVTT